MTILLLLTNESLSDVTLVTEDKKKIRAHKNILSACSPFLKDVFQEDKNLNIIIYLQGIQSIEAELIIQLIYFGEAIVYKERRNELLSVIRTLEIKELCNAFIDKNGDLMDEELKIEAKTKSDEKRKQTVSLKDDLDQSKTLNEVKIGEGESEKLCPVQVIKLARYACNKCDYNGTHMKQLTMHIKRRHEGVKYACDQCDYKAQRKDTFIQHIKSVHDGVRYECDQCDYKATQKVNLTLHVKKQHECVKYFCDKCNHQSTTRWILNLHKKNKHDGVWYPCNQCDYKATQQSNLTKHIQSQHEGIKYDCSQCEFKCRDPSGLKKHVQSKHESIEYYCENCTFKSTSLRYLKKHYSKKH